MIEHRFKLAKYKGKASRLTCPRCKSRNSFAPYVDSAGEITFPDYVGRCDNEVKCGENYTPKMYFAEDPINKPAQAYIASEPVKVYKPIHIPHEIVSKSLKYNNSNLFIQFLMKQFDPIVVSTLINKYLIGTSDGAKWWNKGMSGQAAIFWFINIRNEVRYGQVKQFDEAGHTDKYEFEGDRQSCTTGIHTLIKQSYKRNFKPLPDWLTSYIDYMSFDKALNCLFGEHLLTLPENNNKPIAIVEAPKTSIVASVFLPQYLWLAVGSLSYLTADRCRVLSGRQITLFPDLGAYDKWQTKAEALQHIANFTTSDILERIATDEDRAKGLDLCDYLVGDTVRRELIESFKQTILNEAPVTENDYCGIWLRFCDIGLRRSDAAIALKELMEEHEFEIIENENQLINNKNQKQC